MRILGIESTCDETSVGIVDDGVKIIKNVVATSADFQKKFGGVVPEIAAREQLKSIIPVLMESLNAVGIDSVDEIAVAAGPGLIGSLLIGVETAKTLSIAINKPLIKVNHLVGHIYANWLNDHTYPKFPLIALIISGGHTDLVFMSDHGKYKWLGGTVDDSCGEAFDKVAKLLGLDYPGGPEIEKEALKYNQDKPIMFPRPKIHSDDFDFSFSGLKTAVLSHALNKVLNNETRKNICYSFQLAVADVLVSKTLKVQKKYQANSIVVGGGVAANNFIKNKFFEVFKKENVDVWFPEKKFSVDNGSMIAGAAFFNKNYIDPLALSADPGLHFD